MFRNSLAIASVLALANAVSAATWADGLFDELSKDFGSVPRGPTLKHNFRVVNKTKNDVSISSVTVSCGCVTARAVKNYLRPGEETVVEALMDSTRFTGPKSVTIFVRFGAPAYEEVRLWVQANGRNDFAFTPDTFAFGAVKRGTAPTAKVRVTFYGQPGAKITEVKGESNYVQPTATQVKAENFESAYEIDVKMRADTPVGKWYTDVWVKTNLAGMTQLRIPVTVEIESPLTVSHPVVALGQVKPKEETKRNVIVRGTTPFKITAVKGTDKETTVSYGDAAKEVHVLTIKHTGEKAGAVDKVLKVVTDLKGENEIDVRFQAVVGE